MSLEQYVSIVKKHWKLISICFVLVGAGAFTGSKLMTPYYQSTALIEIAIRSGTNQIDYSSLLASDQLVQTEAILATSDPVLREVASHYSGLSAEQLTTEVTASSRPNTQLFEIDVQDPSPERAAALANDIATTLIKQQDELAQQSGVYLLMVQTAQPNPIRVRPNTLLYTGAGLLAGLFLGILLAMLFEILDVRVRTPEELTQLLDSPVLATILRASSNEDIVNPTGRNPNVEAFRILRTNIGFLAVDKPLHTLVVTSAVPRDGKSAVAANLAIFMAAAGKKTLLIDADLRLPVQHEQFGIPGESMGLSNAILTMGTSTSDHLPVYHQSSSSVLVSSSDSPSATKLSLDPYVYATDIPNLCVMPSGPLPPNPPELLDSKAMQSFFEALASSGAEIVIFDTPPLLGLSDASILASKVDGALIVVDITRARKGNLKQMKDLLGQTGVRVIGCVVNKQRRSRRSSTYSYYYYGEGKHNNRRNHRATNVNAIPVSRPITPDVLKDLEESKPNMVEKTNGRNHHANSTAAIAKTLEMGNQPTDKLSTAKNKEG